MKTACEVQLIHHCQATADGDCDFISHDDFFFCNHQDENGYCLNEKAWPENQETTDEKERKRCEPGKR